MLPSESQVHTSGNLATVAGRFFRAVAPGFERNALAGSSKAGRYSRPEQPTLYLSASVSGVQAAMMAHSGSNEQRPVLAFDVKALNIFDLRVPDAFEEVQRNAGDPFVDWQSVAARGGEPTSWRVRDWIEGTGAMGLIDPSRKVPGLWHLVLFSWNVDDSPSVGRSGS